MMILVLSLQIDGFFPWKQEPAYGFQWPDFDHAYLQNKISEVAWKIINKTMYPTIQSF